MVVRQFLLFFFAAVLMTSACHGGETVSKKRVIWVGEVSPTVQMYIDMIGTDPRFQLVATVPCNILILPYEEALKFVRIYLPRKYSDLVSGVDVMIFHDFSPKILTPRYLEWFRKGVYEGMGLMLVEFAQRISMCGMEYWQDTSLYDAFPGELYPNCLEAYQGRKFYKIARHGPLVDFPQMETVPFNWGHHGDLIPRETTTVWAIWRGRKTPALVSRPYGDGMVLHYDHGWDTIPDETKRFWRYLPDYIFNHLCFVSGLPFPDDLELTHEVRSLFSSIKDQKRVALSVIEFIDSFGANLRPFEIQMAEMRNLQTEAEAAYIKGDLVEAQRLLRQADEQMRQLSNEMMRAKNRAMMWIFVIEWLTVTATGMICGFLLWTLMVRRRLYREVDATRLKSKQQD